MIKELLEKLMKEKFEDVFQPISDEEGEQRQYYDEDELADYFMAAPLNYSVNLYGDYVGPLHSVIANELIEQLPDEVLHKLYVARIKGVDEKDFEYDEKEIHQWAKEAWKKKKKVKESFEDVFKPTPRDEIEKRIEGLSKDDMEETIWDYLVTLHDVDLQKLYFSTCIEESPLDYVLARKIIECADEDLSRELYKKAINQ